jgi:cephalosporin hydroxylase
MITHLPRSNPEIEFDVKYLDMAAQANERYGWLWMRDECLAALEFLDQNVKGPNFIEIGSANGASFALWAQFIQGKKISVDWGVGAWTGDTVRRARLWTDEFTDVHSIVGNSNDPSSRDQVAAILGEEQVEWLFIDGDHNYEPTKIDFEFYGQFVRPGGFIGFHDINHPGHLVGGCGQFWRQLEGKKCEIAWHWAGIGILTKV